MDISTKAIISEREMGHTEDINESESENLNESNCFRERGMGHTEDINESESENLNESNCFRERGMGHSEDGCCSRRLCPTLLNTGCNNLIFYESYFRI